MLDHIDDYINSIEKRLKDTEVLTDKNILVNCIVSSKKLIVEIEALEDLILKNQKEINTLLILGAKFELLLQDIKSISKQYFK